MQEPKFIVEWCNKSFEFDFGSKAFIFHTTVYRDITDADLILEMVELVYQCYILDDNRTPLGSLADFIIEFWDEYKDMSRSKILEEFYLYL